MSSLSALREALKQSPDNLPLLQLFAQACLEDLALDEARSTYDAMLSLNPTHAEAKLGIARVLYLGGQLSEALVRTETFLRDYPGHASAWILLSRLHWADEQRESAREAYEKAREVTGFVPDSGLEKDLYGHGGVPDRPTAVPVSSTGEPMSSGFFGTEDAEEKSFARYLEKANINFASVGGMDVVKEEIRMKILYPLKNPELFKAYGKKIGGGVLMYGPPGCGKTLLSKATAGEIEANFMAIGLHQILDLYLGNSEKNLHQIFELARAHAPTVLFFDEVDALAADRTDMKKSAGRTLINQFLSEMDGTNSNNEGVLILGATNAPWHIDPAFRRPGRFDRVLFVPPPDEEARASVIEILAKNKPVDRLDAKALARKTKDFSGADLKSVFDQAIELSLAKAMKEGRVVPLTMDELIRVAKDTKPSTKAWFDSAKNYALYSNQGGFYNDVLSFLGIVK